MKWDDVPDKDIEPKRGGAGAPQPGISNLKLVQSFHLGSMENNEQIIIYNPVHKLQFSILLYLLEKKNLTKDNQISSSKGNDIWIKVVCDNQNDLQCMGLTITGSFPFWCLNIGK